MTDVNKLTELPETGMGYQVVRASKFLEKDIKTFIVYNSQLALVDDSEFNSEKIKLKTERFSSALIKAEPLMLSTSLEVLNEDEARNLSSVKRDSFNVNQVKAIWNKRQVGVKGAIDNPKLPANGKEMFVRVSAYEDDKRIDFANEKLKPGSYTTTEQDYKDCVESSDEPIDRYALPNEEAITWAFYIRPTTSDSLQRGIVQPAFGHSGGGIEAYFDAGTSNDTYLEKRTFGK